MNLLQDSMFCVLLSSSLFQQTETQQAITMQANVMTGASRVLDMDTMYGKTFCVNCDTF